MTHTGGVTTVAPPAPSVKKDRSKQTALDMLRSLAVIMAVVVPLWFFAQASPGDSKHIRPISTTAALADLQQLAPGVPAPGALPPYVVPTVVDNESGTLLRIGYVIGKGENDYAEYAAGRGDAFVKDLTGAGVPVGTVQAGGATWQELRAQGGALSLLRQVTPPGQRTATSIVLGGVRQKGSLSELVDLAGALTTS